MDYLCPDRPLPPPEPPFYIDTFELWDQSPDQGTDQTWKAPEIDLGDGRTLVQKSA